MTEKQRTRFYFPAWGRCCHANDWRMANGRLVGQRADVHGVADVNALYQQVWDTAERLAVQAHCAVTADLLRHACHTVAVGRDKSANDLTNAEVDRVVALFRLLTDPDDLDAVIALHHPENAERERLVFSLKQRAPHSRLLAIARNLKQYAGEWEEPFWEDMPIEGLRVLSRIINRDQRAEPVASHQGAAVSSSEDPF